MLLVAVQYFDSDQCYLVTAGLSQLAFQSVELGEGTAVWQAAMAQVPLLTAHGVRQAVLTRWHACVQRPQVTPLGRLARQLAQRAPRRAQKRRRREPVALLRVRVDHLPHGSHLADLRHG